MDQFAFLFPGQGSQVVGMGKELAELHPTARRVFEEADQILGFPLSAIMWEGPQELLNDTVNAQPALVIHSVAVLRLLEENHPEIEPVITAGHSVGEFSALVAAGALGFTDALKLVRRRGELMKEAGELYPGGMAAILGLDLGTLELICQEASSTEEVVQVANDNCPGQVVISGSSGALERAITLAQQAGARRARSLAVSVATHSPLMAHGQQEFNRAIETTPFVDPHIAVVGNVSAQPLMTAAEVRADLRAQLTSRVRWVESIEWIKTQGVSNYLELGSGSVLAGLIKRIDPEANCFSIGSPVDYSKL